jgi:hypothetical protein
VKDQPGHVSRTAAPKEYSELSGKAEEARHIVQMAISDFFYKKSITTYAYYASVALVVVCILQIFGII